MYTPSTAVTGAGSTGTGAYRKKVVLSYEIRNEEEKYHRAGVNSIQVDHHRGRLYTGGRDAVIRVWSTETGSWIANLDHHQNWVSDIVLCCNNRNLLSCSNDTTVKVWNAHKGFCMSTLRTHKDYVKALAYAPQKEMVASAGLDTPIFLWDVNALTALTLANSTITTTSITSNKYSIYSLAINNSGSILASGSTEKVVRIWDTRTCTKIMKLKAHTDNVRALLISRDGSHVISASSDGTIRLWSLGQQRCISTIRSHTGGVWTLAANESFSTVYSGGKDQNVIATSLANLEDQWIVCHESAPVLKLLHDAQSQPGESLWVSTTNSAVKKWSLNPKADTTTNGYSVGSGGGGNGTWSEDSRRMTANDSALSENLEHDIHLMDVNRPATIQETPELTIRGNPSIRHYRVLNDKRYILTRDSEDNVDLYDVLTASKVESLDTGTDFEEEIKRRFKQVYVPNWFSVDLKTGMLGIQLEEPECFAAWVSAKEYGFVAASEPVDPKLNLGGLLLQALLEHWPQTDVDPQADPQELSARGPANHYFSVPLYTPIMLSEISNGSQKTLLRLLVGDAKRDAENDLLLDTVPGWIADVTVGRNMPKFIKIPFFLTPHPASGIKPLRKERLSASDMLQARKVMEHIYEKILQEQQMSGGCGEYSASGSATAATTSTGSDHGASPADEAGGGSNSGTSSAAAGPPPLDTSCAEEKIQLFCQDTRIPASMDLRTVRHYYWKNHSADLVINYKLVS